MDDDEPQLDDDVVEEGFKLTWKHRAAICGAAMTLCGPFLSAHEGDVLKSYRDIGGHWAACRGVDGAIPNHTYTRAECDAMNNQALQIKVSGVAQDIRVPVTPQLLAAHVSFAYNIGLGAYKKSQTLRLTNAGHLAEGCSAMLNFYRAGGYDCRVRANNCYGVYARRLDEVKLCMGGIK